MHIEYPSHTACMESQQYTRDDTTESSPNNKIHFRSRITKENISIKFFGQVPFRSADNEPVYNDRSELILAWLLTLPPILFLSSAHHSGNGDPPLNGHANNLSHPACPKCDAQIGHCEPSYRDLLEHVVYLFVPLIGQKHPSRLDHCAALRKLLVKHYHPVLKNRQSVGENQWSVCSQRANQSMNNLTPRVAWSF